MNKMIVIAGLLLMGQMAVFSQESRSDRQEQADLYNEVYVSYGLGSLYYFVNQDEAYSFTTTGTILAGFTRTINRVIGVGFQASYGNVVRTKEATQYSSAYSYDDNYWQGIAYVRFRYLNKPMFCMYSGMGIGVTMDYYTEKGSGYTKNGQKLLPAGQMTLLGFRVGRALAFFGEFGIGTGQIINAGISYKFGE